MPDRFRRRFIAGATATILGGPAAQAAQCLTTPAQTEGPFYPVSFPEDDWDLTRVAGRRAEGDIVEVEGRIIDGQCRPVAGAAVEIWQCNQFGRYHHPRDRGREDRPLDPGFQGFGRVSTDAQGRYRFRTIMPVPYPAGAGRWRTAHIHYKVAVGERHRLTTQLYVADHPYNDQDWIFMAVPEDKRPALTTAFAHRRADGTPVGQFDLVI